jgi:hypothetical protein
VNEEDQIMRDSRKNLTKTFLVLFLLSAWFLPAAQGAPVTFQLKGGAMELQFPDFPLTPPEAQELTQKLSGDATLTLVYDAAAMVAASGAFRYVSPSGPAFILTVTNTTGTSTFSFSEYLLFLDDSSPDTLILTPFLPADTTVTLSSGRAVQVDLGLILQDATGTAVTSTSAPPATLDFGKLNFREYSFFFLNDDGSGNGFVKGGLRLSP